MGVVLEDGAALAFEEAERGAEDVELELGLVGGAERPPELEGHPEGAGRPDALRVIADQADAGRRDALRLNVVSERADGARTERSDGHEERAGDAVILQEPGDLRAGLDELGRVGGAHEGVVPLRYRADRAGGGERV